MTFDWNDYLKFARKLATNGKGIECAERIAVSRAYYSLFHQCADFAERNGRPKVTKRGGEHSALPAWFRLRRESIDLQEAGEKLRQMRDARELCDYQGTVPDLSAQIELALSHADEIKRLLKIPL